MKKSKLKSGMRALNRCQAIKAACEQKRTKLHGQFGAWITKNCIGWASGVLTPDFNWQKNCKRYTMVSVGFRCYLIDDQRVPKKYHAVIGIYKKSQRDRNFVFVPEITVQKPTAGQITARAFISGEAYV